ncbi:uncharacterized protein EDB93DRAFT_274932 [Suillus bovinus]|uniref:uncharacterized protein n=1 Tax=Suillus bovinus TaxID=48563 RepID=UPI001B874D8F|nr:uncharacterized protein EDB93DRAFT_274932 [Suillus bovinus]KAG2159241.1 hypothetical protein EDB93DRAFT_274932 [Suillus bovinus]
MSEDRRPNPPPEVSVSRETTARESSTQPRNGFRQTLRKFKKNVNKKVSKHFKCTRRQIPAVQNADHAGASSNQNIEEASRLHPSEDDKPATSKNISGCVKPGASGEPASKIPDPKSVDAELRKAREGTESMRLLGGHITSVVSKVEDGPKISLPQTISRPHTFNHSKFLMLSLKILRMYILTQRWCWVCCLLHLKLFLLKRNVTNRYNLFLRN